MDLKEQVARRRAELAGEEREEREALDLIKADVAKREKEQREQAVDQIAVDLAASGMPVKSKGEEIVLLPQPKPIDVEGLKRSKLIQLRDREARRLWTPGDNWLVISLIAAGAALLHVAGLGAIPILIGLSRRGVLNKRYREQVMTTYPQIREALS